MKRMPEEIMSLGLTPLKGNLESQPGCMHVYSESHNSMELTPSTYVYRGSGCAGNWPVKEKGTGAW